MSESGVKAFHYSTLQEFNEDYYKGLLTCNHIKEEIAIGSQGEQMTYWVLEKGKKKFLLDSDYYDDLPLKEADTEVITNKGKVYHHLVEICSVKYKSEEKMPFRELVDTFAPFVHSNPSHFTLYKIIGLVSYISRINVRVSSNPAFGKDSVFSILNALRNDTPIINPHSMPSIEYRLNNKVLVLTEISNLKKDQRKLLQEFFLITGDMKNIYEKTTRANSGYGTQDTYDISKLSLVINFNRIQDYEKTGQHNEFFDFVFQPAVLDRFCPFLFDGKLDVQQFTGLLNPHKELQKNMELYKSIIHTLEYWSGEFDRKDSAYEYEGSLNVEGRHWTSFMKIAKGISFYARDREEYNKLVSELYKCYVDYLKMTGAIDFSGKLESFLHHIPEPKEEVVKDEVVEEIVQDEPEEPKDRGIDYEALKQFIELHDEGDGTKYVTILKGLGLDDDSLEDTLNYLLGQGEIYEPKIGKFKRI